MCKEKWIQTAIKLAKENEERYNRYPFGAVIVKQGEIVGKGVNTVQDHHDPTMHAEIEAIRDACRNLQTTNLEGCELYASTEPCPMCLSAVYFTKINQVYFAEMSTPIQNYIYGQLATPREERDIRIVQIELE